MKEIGGYFELEKTSIPSGEYHKNTIHLNLGRNALVYLIRAKKIKKIYLPYFLCDSVENVCLKEGVSVSKYHINSSFEPILDTEIEKDEYVYVVNYYGQLSNESIRKLQKKYKHIIIDNVQALFQKPIRSVDTIYSCRKYFGVPDGAYLYTDQVSLSLDKDNSSERFAHLLGRKEEGAQKHYQNYVNNELLLNNLSLRLMSKETQDILGSVDYNRVRERRNKNFTYLNKELRKLNGLSIKRVSAAFCYPLFLSNGSELKQYLIKNKVYIPTLWPNLKGLNDYERSLVADLLPLPCDQRYTIKDMEYIVKLIKDFVK